jgi:hypothetical protein
VEAVSAPEVELEASIDRLEATALRIKHERDALLGAAVTARVVIAHDRDVLVNSFKDHRTGRVEDAAAKPWLDEYNAALAALDAAIGASTGSAA